MFRINENRSFLTPMNSFYEQFPHDSPSSNMLKGIDDIDNQDDEAAYYIYSSWKRKWSKSFVLSKHPYILRVDGNVFYGKMLFSKRNRCSFLCSRGDSGAIVINKSSKLVGMVYAGSYITGLVVAVTRIKNILKAFGDLNLTLC